MNLDKILSIFKKKSFWITVICIVLSVIVLSISSYFNSKDNKPKNINNTEIHDLKKTYLYIPKNILHGLSNKTDENGLFTFSTKVHENTDITVYYREISKNNILFKDSKFSGAEIKIDLSQTDYFSEITSFKIIVVAKQPDHKKQIKTFSINNGSSAYSSYFNSSMSESEEKAKASSLESNKNVTNPSDSSDDMNDAIKDIVGSSSDFDDVDVNGSYVADPYNAVITVTSDKDVRVVMAAVLGNIQKNAGDKLNNFDSISISIKDSNRNYALKTDYNVSTIMNNSKVYEPFKVKSLANSWSEN